MTSTPDITIIGGGILGMLTAREFSIAGASVTIIEKTQTGRESSWAGGGILLPLYPWRQDPAITRLTLQSLAMYPDLSHQLTEATGIDPEWLQCGMLISKNPDFDLAIDWCRNHHIPFAEPELALLEQFNTTPLNPLFLPTIAQARNPRLLKALKKDMVNRNIIIVENCELLSIEQNQTQHHVQAILTSNGRYPVNHLVLTAGAWSGQLWQALTPEKTSNKAEIYPVKGQMLLFDTKPGTLQQIILDSGSYLIPRTDGKILAGSTVEMCGFNKDTTEVAKQQLEAFARNLFPALSGCPVINHWAGVRPGTDKGIPYIDTHPTIDNLSINAGHFRNGLAMGPASAQLLVDQIMNRPPSISPDPYRLNAQH